MNDREQAVLVSVVFGLIVSGVIIEHCRNQAAKNEAERLQNRGLEKIENWAIDEGVKYFAGLV